MAVKCPKNILLRFKGKISVAGTESGLHRKARRRVFLFQLHAKNIAETFDTLRADCLHKESFCRGKSPVFCDKAVRDQSNGSRKQDEAVAAAEIADEPAAFRLHESKVKPPFCPLNRKIPPADLVAEAWQDLRKTFRKQLVNALSGFPCSTAAHISQNLLPIHRRLCVAFRKNNLLHVISPKYPKDFPESSAPRRVCSWNKREHW